MKYKFECSIVVAAASVEDALGAVASHISTVNRQMASGVEDCAPEFAIAQVDDKADAVDLTDKVSQKFGPIELDLDPKSTAGIALEQQKAAAKAEAKTLIVGVDVQRSGIVIERSDAEVMAEHSAREQATLAAPQS